MPRFVVLGAVLLCLCAFAAPAQAVPHAQITSAPAAQTQDTTAAFEFVATATALLAHFECRLDGGRWTTCGSPMVYRSVAPGDHSFEVRLIGIATDARSDVRHWKVLPPLLPIAPPLPPPDPPDPPNPRPPSGCADANANPSEVSGERLANALTCLVVAERRVRRLPALRRNAKLQRAATTHAIDMLENRFFGHRSAAGSNIGERARAVGYLRGARRWEVGEALHWGEGSRSSPRRAVEELLRSPGHRKIVLSRRLRDVGVAAVTYTRAGSGRTAATYVVNMGRRWR